MEGESWADMLERRSPEGAAKVQELRDAEQACLALQARISAALGQEHREAFVSLWDAYEASFEKINRLRLEVYRMAHH